jgi:hypothetical protein
MKLPVYRDYIEPITWQQIERLEEKIQHTLPMDYKEFLMENNGARAHGYEIKFQRKYHNEYEEVSAFVIEIRTVQSLLGSVCVEYDEENPDRKYLMITIGASGGDGMFFSLNEETYCWIYWADMTHEGEFIFVAKTFTEFINRFELNPDYAD